MERKSIWSISPHVHFLQMYFWRVRLTWNPQAISSIDAYWRELFNGVWHTTDPEICWRTSKMATHPTGVSIDILGIERMIVVWWTVNFWSLNALGIKKKHIVCNCAWHVKLSHVKNTSLTQIRSPEVLHGWTIIGCYAPWYTVGLHTVILRTIVKP